MGQNIVLWCQIDKFTNQNYVLLKIQHSCGEECRGEGEWKKYNARLCYLNVEHTHRQHSAWEIYDYLCLLPVFNTRQH